MNTICIQIGNSDDKLTQKEWSDFVKEIQACCVRLREVIWKQKRNIGLMKKLYT